MLVRNKKFKNHYRTNFYVLDEKYMNQSPLFGYLNQKIFFFKFLTWWNCVRIVKNLKKKKSVELDIRIEVIDASIFHLACRIFSGGGS